MMPGELTAAGTAAGPVGTALGGLADVATIAFSGIFGSRTPDNPNFMPQFQQMLSEGLLPPGTTVEWLRANNWMIKHRLDWPSVGPNEISRQAWYKYLKDHGQTAAAKTVGDLPIGTAVNGGALGFGSASNPVGPPVPATVPTLPQPSTAASEGPVASGTGWVQTSDDEEAQLGTEYRTWYWLPGSTAGLVPAISTALRAAKALGNAFHASVHVVAWEIFTPQNSPSYPGIDAPVGSYVVRVRWAKHGGGTPVLVLALIIMAIITAVAGWVIVTKVTEKQFHEVGSGIGSAFDKLLSPGLVIAAMVIVVVLVARRR